MKSISEMGYGEKIFMVLDKRFSVKYQHFWSSLFKKNGEAIRREWIRVIKQLGEAKVSAVLKYLDSSENNRYTKYPPLPQEFVALYKEIPTYFDSVRTKLKRIDEYERDIYLESHRKPVSLKTRILIGVWRYKLSGSIQREYEDVAHIIKKKKEEWDILRKELQEARVLDDKSDHFILKKILKEFENEQ